LRILFLALDIDLSRPRGDTVHTLELSRGLCQLGHSVVLVVGAGSASPAIPPEEARVYEVSGSDLQAVLEIGRIVRDRSPDVVYERRFSPKIGFTVARFHSLPVVLEVNGILHEELAFQGRSLSATAIRLVKERVRRAMLKRVDAFVAVSTGIRDELIGAYGVRNRRIHVIGNGVNTDRFRPGSKAQASASVGLDPVKPRFVFVGNLVGWRDFESLTLSMKLVLREVPEAELVIVGEGPERKEFEDGARRSLPRGSVRFVGSIPPSDVPSYICASDVGLLPERVRQLDVSPLKLFEYMACGRPVVAYRVAGLEILEEVGAGALVAPGDAAGLAKTLVELFQRQDLRDEMGVRGRAFVERERSWGAVAARVSAVLEEAGRGLA
jgi:glycosyltransferase involved in cell wall biosynthesis